MRLFEMPSAFRWYSAKSSSLETRFDIDAVSRLIESQNIPGFQRSTLNPSWRIEINVQRVNCSIYNEATDSILRIP